MLGFLAREGASDMAVEPAAISTLLLGLILRPPYPVPASPVPKSIPPVSRAIYHQLFLFIALRTGANGSQCWCCGVTDSLTVPYGTFVTVVA